jgi:hypothetical protein
MTIGMALSEPLALSELIMRSKVSNGPDGSFSAHFE